MKLALKHNTYLPTKFSIIVPSTNYDKKVSPGIFRKREYDEEKWMSREFGGETAIKTIGGWIKGKKLIHEKGELVESYTTNKRLSEVKHELERHIKQRKKDWHQHAIGYEIGNGFNYW